MHRSSSTPHIEKNYDIFYNTFYTAYGSQQQINNEITTTKGHKVVTTQIIVKNHAIYGQKFCRNSSSVV